MENTDSIENYISSINTSIDVIRKNKDDIKDLEVPSDFKLMMTGAKDSKILNFIFDNKLDKIIDNLLNKLSLGSYDEIEQYSDIIKKVFNSLGIGEGAFEGPVSQLVLNNITNSLNSIDMNMTKNKVRKVMLLINNLKKQTKSINNTDTKEKYIEAVKALKQVLKFIAKVYKNRRIITNRVRQGLNNIIHEDTDCNESLEGY